jgi:hypothetical protein
MENDICVFEYDDVLQELDWNQIGVLVCWTFCIWWYSAEFFQNAVTVSVTSQSGMVPERVRRGPQKVETCFVFIVMYDML